MNMVRLTLPFDAFTTDMKLARESVAKVAQLQPHLVCFGHGPVLVQDAPAKLNAFAKRVC
jgi:glyoxylase-like metal-dependent hydrolase (beta-lactamase superfamily II)